MDPSKLDEYGYCFFDQVIPLEMLDRVLAEVDTFLMDQWDPIFQQYPGVHRGPDANDRRVLSAPLPATRGDIRHSEITYHDLPATTNLSNFILEIVNEAFDSKHILYNSAHAAPRGHERQSVHHDMHKICGGLRALTVFYVENYDLDANHGTDTIILPNIRAGLPQPWDPVPIDLRRGNFFVFYSDLIHAGGAMPLSLPANSWPKWEAWALPTSRPRINLRRGSMSHFGHSRSTPRSPPSNVAQWTDGEVLYKFHGQVIRAQDRPAVQGPCGRTVPCVRDPAATTSITSKTRHLVT